MTFSNVMAMIGSGKKKPAPPPSPEQKPPGPKKADYSAYWMLALGLLLFTVGGMFNNAPLKGQHKLLVATAEMPMKELQKTVLLVVRHDRGGAQGLVLNVPGYGGPTEKNRVFAVHTLDVTLPETIPMPDIDLGVLEGKEAIEKLKKEKTKPSWYIIVHGYAGWAAHQMESEVSTGQWELVEFDKDALIKTPPAKLWDTARKLPKFEITH